MKTVSTGRSKILYIIVIALVVVGGILGYKFRGKIRLSMLNFLHSFDDSITESSIEEPLLPPGRWCQMRGVQSDSSQESNDELELIRSLGYLSGYENAPSEQSVTVYDSSSAYNGYTILLSGHAPGITMIDMTGREVHNWYTDDSIVDGLWPEVPEMENGINLWRRMYLSRNGDLFVIIEGAGVIKVDKDSNLLWASAFNDAHHDIDVDDEGNIYVIGRDVHINEQYNPEEHIAEDYIYILDPMGNSRQRISILDALRNSPYAPLLRRMEPAGDILHCNTVEYISEDRLPADYSGPLRGGTILISLRSINLVCAVDPVEESVYWAESDLWFMQHQPTLLEDGNMMVFDNQGHSGSSAIIEFDPITREILWSYMGTEENPFYSEISGSCQPLPNGNVLITESVYGRALEVTPDKDIVWEYYNPHRAGESNELIAILFDAVRIEEEYTAGWLPNEMPPPEVEQP